MNPAREVILSEVQSALKRSSTSDTSPIASTARFRPRVPGDATSELNLLLSEVEKLGGKTRRLESQAELGAALAELINSEAIKKATLWQTEELKAWGVEEELRKLGVEIASPRASNREVAECDLGVTGADYALPETGTLVLRSSPEKPRTASLVPRAHLAIIRPTILRADLHQVFDEAKQDGYFVFITGPSRTSDIELTLTVGVHGPKTLCLWVMTE